MSVSSETIMYIVSHKDFDAPQLPGYVPILAGAVKNHASIEVKDNNGDNISAKNPGFCELTAQYWGWKNRDDRDANIGFVHYRRYFYIDHRKAQIVPAEQFSRDLAQYDVVLPEPWVLRKSIGDEFAQFQNLDDLEVVCSIMQEQCPEYVPALDELLKSHSLHAYNMFVMSGERFDAYMTWLFRILDEAERRIDVSKYDAYNQRLFGFLSERLLNVWVNARKLRVKEYPVYMPEQSARKENLRTRVKSLLFEHKL